MIARPKLSWPPLLSLLGLLGLALAPAWVFAQEQGVEPAPEAGPETASEAEPEPDPAPDGDATPWDGATDVSLPPFLQDTGKRIVDERPPPSEQQLEALRQLEEEVERFSETGEAFRSTVTSLVRREYLLQRRERDRWYGEQLEAEEREFNEARENSIRVFEEFLRRYPTHPK